MNITNVSIRPLGGLKPYFNMKFCALCRVSVLNTLELG